MLRMLMTLLTALTMTVPTQETAITALFQSGMLLRCHVVAADDTLEMQQIKLAVRDAVQHCYASADPSFPMEHAAQVSLPALTDAACIAAREAGFDGSVSVTLEKRIFPERTSGLLTLPAGEYPALMVRLGDAQGQNWWGLIDPELSRCFACIGEGSSMPAWDWSLRGLFRALFRWHTPVEGG